MNLSILRDFIEITTKIKMDISKAFEILIEICLAGIYKRDRDSASCTINIQWGFLQRQFRL